MNWEVFEGVTDLKSEAIYAILNYNPHNQYL